MITRSYEGLLEIESSIGVLDVFSLRRLVMETQEYILHSEKSSLEALPLEKTRSTGLMQKVGITR